MQRNIYLVSNTFITSIRIFVDNHESSDSIVFLEKIESFGSWVMSVVLELKVYNLSYFKDLQSIWWLLALMQLVCTSVVGWMMCGGDTEALRFAVVLPTQKYFKLNCYHSSTYTQW